MLCTSFPAPHVLIADDPWSTELRQRFDNGEDPNDPMANAGGSGGPFQQGPGPEFFQQFFAGGSGFPGGGGGGFHGGQRARGGGGQQFKFHWG